ncbi:hypothetical protein ACOSQ2_009621 [Xanthoceras sorbifolium]
MERKPLIMKLKRKSSDISQEKVDSVKDQEEMRKKRREQKRLENIEIADLSEKIDMIGLEIENEEQLKEYQKNKRKMRHENRLKQYWKTVMDTGLKNNRPATLITLNNTQPHNKGKLEDAVKEEEEEEKNKKKEPEVSNHISLITLFMGSEKSRTAMARRIMSNEKLKEHYNNKVEELKMKIEVEKMDPAVKTRMEKRIQRWEIMKETWDTMRSSTDPEPQAMSVSEEEKK